MPGPAVPAASACTSAARDWSISRNTLLQPLSIFIVSEVFVIGFGVLFVVRSTRSILKIFRYTLPLSLIGLLAFAVGLLMHSTRDAARELRPLRPGRQRGPACHRGGRRLREGERFLPVPFSLAATVLAITWPSFSLPYYLGSAYFAGEVRSGRRVPSCWPAR